MSTTRLSPAQTAVACLVVLAGAPVAPVAAQQPPAQRPIADVLAEYVAAGLAGNLALQREDFSVEQSLAALREARGRYFPAASFELRASRASGGRTIELRLGELLNPVYSTLNDLLVAQGQPPAFGAIENTEFRFLREQEQQTYVRVTQPLYAPAITAGVNARSALADAQRATRDTVARTLVRDIRVAYHQWMSSREGLAIVNASRELLSENLRVSRSLHDNGRVTRDQVLRAEAELLDVEQQRVEAANRVDIARSYFNFLLNRPLETPMEPALLPATLAPNIAALEQLQHRAVQERPELRQLAAGAEAARAEVDAARARFKPVVALAVESGIQGEEFGTGPDDDYSIASLTFSWSLFNGNQDRARLAQARLAARSLDVQQEESARRIALEVEQAHGNARAALRAVSTAEARQQAAREAFKIAARKRDAGTISQVEFLDARTALTSAELNFTLTRFDLLTRLAELEFALGTPAPAQVAR
jgi:outer membrane protein